MTETKSVVHSDPEILDGAPLFGGTRIPVETLTDHLAGVYDLEGIGDHFASLRRELVAVALKRAQRSLVAAAFSNPANSVVRAAF